MKQLNIVGISGSPKKNGNVETFLIENGLTSSEKGFITEELSNQFRQLLSQSDFGNLVNTLLAFTGSIFIGVLAVLFITFFLLVEMGPIRNWIISLINNIRLLASGV